jgi:membrane protein DedA with SNARE-associated domain
VGRQGWVLGAVPWVGRAVESALLPLPSEVIMPFAGFLVATGRFDLWFVAAVGAAGNLLGSWAAYALGRWAGESVVRPAVRRYGRWVLVGEDEFDRAQGWLRRYGDAVVLVGRVVPGLRTVVSLPAGLARRPFLRFSVPTLVGSFVWSLALAEAGRLLGQRWESLEPWFHALDVAVAALAVLEVLYYADRVRATGGPRGGPVAG